MPCFAGRGGGSVPGKLMLLARSDHDLWLRIVESAALSHETAKQQLAILSPNGLPTVDHAAHYPPSATQSTASLGIKLPRPFR
jgi:hypothetical protein